MAALGSRSITDVSISTPAPPTIPLSVPSQLLHYPITTLDNVSTESVLTLDHTSAQPVPYLNPFLLSLPVRVPFSAFVLFCDTFTTLALAFMIMRTLFYIKRRRAGLIGPSLAPHLIKFWSLFAFLDSFLHLLHPYLTLFELGSLVTLLRAVILVVLVSGRRFSFAVYLYDNHLMPFYSSHQPEIEHYISALRHTMRRVDDAFKELATYLLQRMAVGGLSGVAQGLSDIFSQAVNQDLNASQQQQHNQQNAHQRLDSRSMHDQGHRKNGVLVRNAEMGLYERGRQFFAGEPEERAKALRGQSVDDLMGVMQTANAEPPKAAYEEVRELRRQFRRRESAMGKIKEGGGG
eukprot:GFKZ01002970.1.p1 GENE.GFKZ01002970.1~~GFKZ01002970.1.p1  ORF type:complete len:348 (-),score=43.68 GFKZ01002970.1:1285-2328(-)